MKLAVLLESWSQNPEREMNMRKQRQRASIIKSHHSSNNDLDFPSSLETTFRSLSHSSSLRLTII
eukprot:125988-Hanusia_phi.AAC.1